MGQYTHHDRGRNSAIVVSPSTVDVSITPKKPKANCAAQGAAISTCAHCHGSLNTHRRVTVCRSGAPVNT